MAWSASAAKRCASKGSSGSATSTRWCGARAPLLGRGLARADVEAAVHLHAVRADDLAAEALGQPHGELGLAAGGGADHHQQLVGSGGVGIASAEPAPSLTSSPRGARAPPTRSASPPAGRAGSARRSPPRRARPAARFASSGATGSPARSEPWQAIVAMARSIAPENARSPAWLTSSSRSRSSRSGEAFTRSERHARARRRRSARRRAPRARVRRDRLLLLLDERGLRGETGAIDGEEELLARRPRARRSRA